MSLPQIQLDDRRFQDLVNEARLRIAAACPEWTEHNVSDPGITLIELFAWMTEMSSTGSTAIPDKLHVALLELLGVQLHGPTAARDAKCASGSAAPPIERSRSRRRDRGRDAAHRQRGVDRVPGRRGVRDPPGAADRVPGPARRALQDDRGRRRRRPSPQGPDRLPFGGPPQVGDALYLGFDEDISQPAARGRDRRLDGARRRRRSRGPAAALGGEPGRAAAGPTPRCSSDLTGGFNYGSGTVELQCPADAARSPLGGKRAALAALPHRRDRPAAGASGAPTRTRRRSTRSRAAPIGAMVPARTRAQRDATSSSGPATAPRASASPCGSRRCSRCGRARRSRSGARRRPSGRAWSRGRIVRRSGPRTGTSSSTSNGGELELGPAVRQPDGGWTQYGSIPSQGAELRLNRYRHGGGRNGNVAAEHADACCAARSRASPRSPTRGRPTAASIPSRSSPHASAPRWRSGPATARSRPRTSSSSSGRLLARRAHDLRLAAGGRPIRSGYTCCPRSSRPTAA